MADKCVETLQPEIGRELCLMKGKNGKYRGYKKDILVENLSERDNIMFVCIRCRGIMRKACTSSDGEQFCSCCKREGERANPNLQMDTMILSFKCSCPLIARGCGWLGALGNCEDHLDTCGYVFETCELSCGVMLQRDELDVHEKEKCPQRIVKCKHCRRESKSCELPMHLDECPKMKVSCELNCGKLMRRENLTQHLEKDCGLVVETCGLGCDKRLTRDGLKIHVRDICTLRLIACEHCKKGFKCCDMSAHVGLCPKMRLSCDLNCGIIMCREDITHHVEQDCVEKVVECPFFKYNCVGPIKRKHLSKHLEERRMEHLELRLNAMQEFIMEESEIIAKQKEKISEQGATIRTMSREIQSLKKEVKTLTNLTGAGNAIPIKLKWRITKVPNVVFGNHTLEQFQVAGYEFKFKFCYASIGHFRIEISPRSESYYEKLRWPFKAEFITRLSSQRNPSNSREFKSEVFVVNREDFNSDSAINFPIATCSRDVFMEYFIDGGAEFEIIVFLL